VFTNLSIVAPPTPTPEPTTLALLVSGLIGLTRLAKRHRERN
jgi:hypothetical protein